MSSPSRTRVLNQLSWVMEETSTRSARRDVLVELDAMLTELEESNLRGYEIPDRITRALKRHGVTPPRGTTAPELIEAIFAVQERYMRQPEQPPMQPAAELLGARRDQASRIAS